MDSKDKVHGEGNYEASRQYNEATKRFVASGKVDQAARDAAPHSPAEAQEMRDAERAALLRAKDRKPGERPPVEEPEQAPAIEDPLPEDGADEGSAAPRR